MRISIAPNNISLRKIGVRIRLNNASDFSIMDIRIVTSPTMRKDQSENMED